MNDIRERGERFAVLLGAELKGAIAAQGTSARQVALTLKRQPANMSMWLSGKRPLPADLFNEICETIGVQPDSIVNRAYERLIAEVGPYVPHSSAMSEPPARFDPSTMGLAAVEDYSDSESDQ